MKPAAFFDLDGTLLTVNSGRLWMRRERQEGRLSRWQQIQAVFYLAGYRFGFIDMQRAMRKALETIVGLEEDTVRRWTEEWYQAKVQHLAAPGGFTALEHHRQQGHPLVLLTSSSPYESEVARRQFDLQYSLSTRYEVREGRFTGEVVLPLCYGPGKVLIAERFAAEQDIDLAGSWFYSDSITDRPMLERVGHPRVVNPDPRLRRLAARRGWEIQDWSGGPASG